MQLRGGVTVACKAHNLDDQVQFLAPQQYIVIYWQTKNHRQCLWFFVWGEYGKTFRHTFSFDFSHNLCYKIRTST